MGARRSPESGKIKTMKKENRSHLPPNISARDRANQYPDVLHECGGKLFCTPCNLVLEHKRKSSVLQHFASAKHNRRLIERETNYKLLAFSEDDDSESLLSPVSRPLCPMDAVSTQTLNLKMSPESLPEHRAGPSVPPQSPTPHIDHHNGPSPPSRSINASSFWKSCNAAGCTEGIFSAFIQQMNDISSRIQAGQASPEDCDRALTVITASGKLEELVAKQQEDLRRKQAELQKAMEAMEQVVSALRR